MSAVFTPLRFWNATELSCGLKNPCNSSPLSMQNDRPRSDSLSPPPSWRVHLLWNRHDESSGGCCFSPATYWHYHRLVRWVCLLSWFSVLVYCPNSLYLFIVLGLCFFLFFFYCTGFLCLFLFLVLCVLWPGSLWVCYFIVLVLCACLLSWFSVFLIVLVLCVFLMFRISVFG